ncbi:MAG TPA: hypothetical protein PKX92_05545 [Edaphocola sp.]|nr:hypothetical protein [Edaphocola sp.]
MNKINSQNITLFIDFLHRKKIGTPASFELIQSWSELNNEEITQHLNNLYKKWELDYSTVATWSDEFLSSSRAKTDAPPMPPKIVNTPKEVP